MSLHVILHKVAPYLNTGPSVQSNTSKLHKYILGTLEYFLLNYFDLILMLNSSV